MAQVEKISDDNGFLAFHRTHGLVFDQGCDFPIAQLSRELNLFGRRTLVRLEEFSVDLSLRLNLFNTAHLINVEGDDPRSYFYEFVAPSATYRFLNGKREQVAGISWPILREYVCTEYSRIKRTQEPDYSQVDVWESQTSTVFRRLIVPLGEWGKVSHLLIVFRPDLRGFVPSTLDDMRPGVLQKEHFGGRSVGPERRHG